MYVRLQIYGILVLGVYLKNSIICFSFSFLCLTTDYLQHECLIRMSLAWCPSLKVPYLFFSNVYNLLL